jgi:hypothetical protein
MDTPITEQVVRDALEASEFVVARAAKRLGVSRQALYRLMRKHAIIVRRRIAETRPSQRVNARPGSERGIYHDRPTDLR